MQRLSDREISAAALSSLLRPTLGLGVDLAGLFARFGFEVNLSTIEETAVDVRLLDRFVAAMVEQAGRPGIGMALGAGFAFDYLPELDTFVTTSATLREAFEAFGWLRRLVAPFVRVGLVDQGDATALVVEPVAAFSPRTARVYAEAVIAATAKFGRGLMGGEAPYQEVRFRHDAPAEETEYAAALGAPVRLGAAEDALVFAPEVLDHPLRGALADLHRQAERRLEARHAALAAPPGVVDRLEQALARDPSLLVRAIGATAATLRVGPRTLQRRLAEAETTFREVQDRVRRRLATAWLEEADLSIDEIAERLGFSERRSFARAFRRWTGRSPAAWRRGPR